MSVPVNQRTHGKLEVCVKAHDLCCYTLQITANKKNFTQEFQESLSDPQSRQRQCHIEALFGVEPFRYRTCQFPKVLPVKSFRIAMESTPFAINYTTTAIMCKVLLLVNNYTGGEQ